MQNDRYMPQVNTKQNFEKLPKTKLSSLQSMVPPTLLPHMAISINVVIHTWSLLQVMYMTGTMWP